MKNKMLWIPQISSLSSDGKVLLNKDSNMAVLRNLMGTKFTDVYDITLAFEFSLMDAIFDSENFKECDRICYNERSYTNAAFERFNFDVEFFQKIKRDYGVFDYVFVNEPTKVLQLKKIFSESKIICYNHWLACDNMPDMIYRQFEGMLNADLCFFNSDFAITHMKNYYKLLFKNEEIVENINYAKAQPTYRGDLCQIKKMVTPGFIYNHRLSSDPYYADAYQILCSICDQLESRYGEANMPIVYFTNPSGKKADFLRPYFKEINLKNQDEYEEFLKSEKICGHINTFFNSKGMWSMSTVDCAKTGNACFLPKRYGYAEIFQDDYKGYCKDEHDMFCKIAQLIEHNNIYDYDNSFIINHNANLVAAAMIDKIENIGGPTNV